MNISENALKALYSAVKTHFNQGRNTHKPIWDKVATLVNSTSGQENYAWLGEFTRLKEWSDERTVDTMAVYDYSIKNVKYEATEGIKAEYIEDDTYGVMMPKFTDMGYAAATHPDELVFQLLAAGFTTTCYDGQYFFDTDHPVGAEGEEVSVANVLMPDDQKDNKAPWFLLDTNRPLKPLIFQKRRDYRLQAKTNPANSDAVFISDTFLYGVDARVSAGFGFWQQAFASKCELTSDNFG
ncbi:Mu-like prophage major head subunit gpT family protein [Candidatus Sororendozoicomonas aggregata]|uniref:Mu-like prophage major head subunit gpT family protein n=1 Tax=Candidatus Sororendozoicomonas aggregata TaxID=3073239 RepID=UPI002ED452B0